jgi:hypothetical protein
MRILPVVAVLALLGSAAVAQTESPKGYTGAYGPDAPIKAFGGPYRRCIRVRAGMKLAPTAFQQKWSRPPLAARLPGKLTARLPA